MPQLELIDVSLPDPHPPQPPVPDPAPEPGPAPIPAPGPGPTPRAQLRWLRATPGSSGRWFGSGEGGDDPDDDGEQADPGGDSDPHPPLPQPGDDA